MTAPQPVTDLDIAFGGSVDRLMPAYADIPTEFKRSGNAYVDATQRWFYSGIRKSEFQARPGVDADAAFSHLCAILNSFDPKHEHKMAAVAYLLSQWFVLRRASEAEALAPGGVGE